MWRDGYPGDYDAVLRRRADEYWEDRFSDPVPVEYEVLVGTDLERMICFCVEAVEAEEAVREALSRYELVGDASVYDDILWQLYLDGELVDEEIGTDGADQRAA